MSLRRLGALTIALLLCVMSGCAAGGPEEFEAAMAEARALVRETVLAANPSADLSGIEESTFECDEAMEGLVAGSVSFLSDDPGGDPVGEVVQLWRQLGLDVEGTDTNEARAMASATTALGSALTVFEVFGVSLRVDAFTDCYRPGLAG